MATSIKRKRDSQDLPTMRPAPGPMQDFDPSAYLDAGDSIDNDPSGMDFSLLAQHNADGDGDEGVEVYNSNNQQQQHQHSQMQPPQQQNSHSHYQRQHDQNPQHELQGHHGHPQQHQQLQGQEGADDDPTQSASDTATAALAQYHTMTVPQPTEHSFLQTAGPGGNGEEEDGQFTLSEAIKSAENRGSVGGEGLEGGVGGAAGGGNGEGSSPTGGNKPAVGSEEWHKVRRDNHKEVERRRRETINEGINELAKIVPGCEKNKGSILSRAVQFISQLKENETQNIEKWTLEKLLTEQAINELSSSCDKLKAECQRAWGEVEEWKRRAGGGVGMYGEEEGKVEGQGFGEEGLGDGEVD